MSSNPTFKQLGMPLLVLYFFSGLTSLAYEVLWVRMLSLQFGVSIFGVIITVSAFMSGLGCGSLIGRRLILRYTNPLRVFAVLEGLVACMALVLPIVIMGLESQIAETSIGIHIIAWYAAELVLSGFLLFLPALLMGAGFPLILSAIRGSGVQLAHVYGINTTGAAIGALIPLFLLPQMGWLDSMKIIALSGLCISLGAFATSMRFQVGSIPEFPKYTKLSLSSKTLLLYAGIGAAALMLEVGWTRIFGMLMLRTEYVVAIILAVFLLGIGLGSLFAERMKKKYWFNVMPVVSCVSVILSLWLVPLVSRLVHEYRWSDISSNMLWQGGVLILVTLPVTIILGAWFPLLVKRYGNDERISSLLYGVNSIGSAIGALLAGFILTPLIGTNGSVLVSAFMFFSLGLVWAHSKKIWYMSPLLLMAAYPVMTMPSVEQLLPQLYHDSHDIYYHEDALTITHVVERKDGQRVLLADLQRMDASSDPASVESQKNQSRLPLLLHSSPKTALFLGLGTGISASAALDFPGLKIDAVELSQGAIVSASKWFAPVNHDVLRHANVYRDDARHYLMTSQNRYDVIIGDLFHPDMVGRGTLLSVQQFQRAQQHLSDNGIFVQWLALNQFDVESLKIVMRSFSQVFPDGMLFIDGFRLALVGSPHFEGVPALMMNLERMLPQQQVSTTGDEGAWTWLGRYWGRIHVSDGKIQQEWAPVIEYRLPQTRANGELDLVKVLDSLLHERPQVQQAAAELLVSESDYPAFERAYIATDLAQRSWLAMLTDKPAEGQRLLQLAYRANPKDRWIGFAVADGALASYEANPTAVGEREVLTSILRIRPDHPDVLKKLWRLEQQAGNKEKADEYRDRFAGISPLSRPLGIDHE